MLVVVYEDWFVWQIFVVCVYLVVEVEQCNVFVVD